ncbi:helix-turn-helix transcriptional regulator [Caldalkalibacillus salinus]|uniref:helix-turn-helix transcriptional regulator n=1 Tax=Caldalkalibacillus salinus TaxID=2803787 RepID=UPI001921B8F0|nr:transcriptional regulator [Caldalkalibacillus salinus]
MSEKLVRLIRIITLIQTRPGITARELAERCETTDRTIYRDMNTLSSANVPITVSEGHGKGYRFLNRFSMYPIDWTEAEHTAFTMLPSLLESSGELLPKDFYSAYEKVMASYHKGKQQKEDMVDSIINVIQTGTAAWKEERTNFLSPVIQAILSQHTIKAVYHTQSRNQTTERKIDPYHLIPRERRFYLIGYCHEKKNIRTFRMSRFLDVTITKDRFEKNDFNINTYLKHTWSIIKGERNIRFKVKFSPKIARYIKEEELFVRPRLKDLPDGGLLFEVTINHEQEFLQWISQYGPEAEILEPQDAREKFKAQLHRWLQLYEGNER